MSPSPEVRRERRVSELRRLTLAVVAAHVVIGVLDLLERGPFRSPATETFTARLFADMGDHPAWPVVHGLAAVWLAVSLWRGATRVSWAHALVSTPVLGVWSLAAVAWGLTSAVPVSLVGGSVTLLVAVTSAVAGRLWDIEHDDHRRASQEG